MNIDEGLKILLKSKVKKPEKLGSFDYFNKPDFKEILKGNIKGISLYVGLKQDWMSGSLYKHLIGKKLNSKIKGEKSIISRHSMYSIQEINKFMIDSENFLKDLHKELGFKEENFQNDLRYAYYQSWNTEQTDYTYFMQISKNTNSCQTYLVIDYKNPNGWSKNLKPKLKILKNNDKINILFNNINISNDLINEILSQGEIIYSNLPKEIDNIVIEGKVLNNKYQSARICAIDLYQGYFNKNPDVLTHEEHINTYENFLEKK